MWVSFLEAPGTGQGGNSINKSTVAEILYYTAKIVWWQ
jgi:hypothetical protein